MTHPDPTPETDPRALDAEVARTVFGFNPYTGRDNIAFVVSGLSTIDKPWPCEDYDFPLTVDGVDYEIKRTIKASHYHNGWVWEHRIGQPWQVGIERAVDQWIDPSTPNYSTDPAAMMQVIEKLTNDWGIVEVMWCDAPNYRCEITSRDGSAGFVGESEISAAHAVCLAALKTVGGGK